mmetsp:Transcript_12315/g.18667  ORF Transcript_12315/g.18667 Transcript_12315/m.18667 type:complete len:578 (-) Transcript_12315:50-1783(-)
MLRDICFNRQDKLSGIRFKPKFLLVGDFDGDGIDELATISSFGEILIHKDSDGYVPADTLSRYPISDAHICKFGVVPNDMIALLGLDGHITVFELVELDRDSKTSVLKISVSVNCSNPNSVCWRMLSLDGVPYVVTASGHTISTHRYISGTKTLSPEEKFQVPGAVKSMDVLEGGHLIVGSTSGGVSVVACLSLPPASDSVDSSAESVPNLSFRLVEVRPGRAPPFPSAECASFTGAAVVRTGRALGPHGFAVAWLDGRICICRIVTAVLAGSESGRGGSEWEVVQCFHTRFALFRLGFLIPSVSFSTAAGGGVSQEEGMEKGEVEIQEEELFEKKYYPTGSFLVAASHSGHTLIISLDEHGSSNSSRVFLFDSRHSFQSTIMTDFGVGNLSHLVRKPKATGVAMHSRSDSSEVSGDMMHPQRSSSAESTVGDDVSSDIVQDQQQHQCDIPTETPTCAPCLEEGCLVYLTASGAVHIVSGLQSHLASVGPPSIPHTRFSSTSVAIAEGVAATWAEKVLHALPSPTVDSEDTTCKMTSSNTVGTAPAKDLITKLMTMSVDDIDRILSSLDSISCKSTL